jgi:hypothetical protein
MPGSHDQTAWRVALVAVLILAAALRLIGLAYGLPAIYNPDEVAIMNRALGLSQTGLDPRNFLYPTLYFYALFAWEGLWFVIGRLNGVYESLRHFETSFFVNPTGIYLAGRLFTVACGVATVLGIYRLADVLFGRFAGFSAALLAAVAPLAVRDAHYVKHDVPVTMLIVWTHVALATDLGRAGGRGYMWAAGLLAGLAMSTHYYAVFLALPLSLAAIHPSFPTEPVRARLRRLAGAGLCSAAAFIAASPFLVIRPMTAWRDIVANREIVMDRATAASGAFGSWGFYLEWLARDVTGLVAFLLAVGGAVICAAIDWRRAGLLVTFPLVFLLFIANTYPASRYLNPIVPFVTVFAGAAVWWLRQQSHSVVRIGAVVLLAMAAIEGAVGSLRIDRFFQQTDTRTLAQSWVERHVPEGTSILIQPYSVPLRTSKPALVEALTAHLGSADRASVRFRKQLDLEPYPAPAYRTIFLGDGGLDVDKRYVAPTAFTPSNGLAPLQALGVTWVVLKRYNVEDPLMSALQEALERGGRLAASFSPYAANVAADDRKRVPPFLHNTDTRIRSELDRPGPIIEVWTID